MAATVEQFIRAHYSCYSAGDGEVRISCPMCGHKGQKCYISFTKNVFFCFHCEAKGSMRSFIYLFHNSARKEVNISYKRQIIDKNYDKLTVPLPDDYRELSTQKSIMALHYLDYIFSRGFTLHTLRHINIGYSGTLSYYLIFPVYDENYKQIYYTTRSIKEDSPLKVYNPSNESNKYIGKSDVLYNIHNAKANATVYITEGIFDCLSLHTLKYNAVASLGKTLSDSQIEILLQNKFQQIIICYDGNARESTYNTAKRLSQYHRNVWMCLLPEGKNDDPNNLLMKNTLQNNLQKLEKYSREGAILARIQKLKNS